jgi:hypothetical protein
LRSQPHIPAVIPSAPAISKASAIVENDTGGSFPFLATAKTIRPSAIDVPAMMS